MVAIPLTFEDYVAKASAASTARDAARSAVANAQKDLVVAQTVLDQIQTEMQAYVQERVKQGR